MRMPSWVVCATLTLTLTACTEPTPCSSCPAIGGDYQVTWTPSPITCGADPSRQRTLAVTQVGSALSASVLGLVLTGPLYDTGDLSLASPTADGSASYRLQATATFDGLTLAAYLDGGTAHPSLPDGGTSAPAVTLDGALYATDLDAGCAGSTHLVAHLAR